MNSSPVSWLDGERADALPLPDRGVELGDGLFETLLAHRGQLLFVDLHLDRLRCGADMLAFSDVSGAAEMQLQLASDFLKDQHWEWASVRLTVTRGVGERGYAPPANNKPRIVIQAYKIDRDAGQMLQPASLEVAALRLSLQPALAGLKHLNRLEQVLAAQEAQQRGFDELLLLSHSGEVVSCIAGNVFLVRSGRIFTPPMVSCGVAGTRRRLIIERWAKMCGYDISVGVITLPDILAADEVFFSNSLITVRSVASIGDHEYACADVATALFEHFERDLQ